MSKPEPHYRSKRHKDKRPVESKAKKARDAAKTEDEKYELAPAKPGPKPGDGGRPLIDIDEEEFENLCGMGCTEQEIAQWFRCDVNTVNRWCVRTFGGTFAEERGKKFLIGKASLRRVRFQRAMAGDATMIIWLSKILLGDTDTSHRVLSGPNGRPISVEAHQANFDLSKLSDKELDLLESMRTKMLGPKGDDATEPGDEE